MAKTVLWATYFLGILLFLTSFVLAIPHIDFNNGGTSSNILGTDNVWTAKNYFFNMYADKFCYLNNTCLDFSSNMTSITYNNTYTFIEYHNNTYNLTNYVNTTTEITYNITNNLTFYITNNITNNISYNFSNGGFVNGSDITVGNLNATGNTFLMDNVTIMSSGNNSLTPYFGLQSTGWLFYEKELNISSDMPASIPFAVMEGSSPLIGSGIFRSIFIGEWDTDKNPGLVFVSEVNSSDANTVAFGVLYSDIDNGGVLSTNSFALHNLDPSLTTGIFSKTLFTGDVVVGNESWNMIDSGFFKNQDNLDSWGNPDGWYQDTVNQAARHNPGSATDSLSQITSVLVGETYRLDYSLFSVDSGTLTPSICGNTLTEQSASGDFSETFICLNNNALVFVPSIDFAGDIDNVSLNLLKNFNLNVSGIVDASQFCLNGDCITSFNITSSGGDNTSWNESRADSKYVPYNGAVSNVDLGSNNLKVDSINTTIVNIGNVNISNYLDGLLINKPVLINGGIITTDHFYMPNGSFSALSDISADDGFGFLVGNTNPLGVGGLILANDVGSSAVIGMTGSGFSSFPGADNSFIIYSSSNRLLVFSNNSYFINTESGHTYMQQEADHVNFEYLPTSSELTTNTDDELVTYYQLTQSVNLGTFWRRPVINASATIPPSSGNVTGDRYIVGSGAIGAWMGKDGNITTWNGNSWTFDIPQSGWAAWSFNDQAAYTWNGNSWVLLSKPVIYTASKGVINNNYDMEANIKTGYGLQLDGNSMFVGVDLNTIKYDSNGNLQVGLVPWVNVSKIGAKLSDLTNDIGVNTSWNESRADSKYALIGSGGNSSWNQSYASTLYPSNAALNGNVSLVRTNINNNASATIILAYTNDTVLNNKILSINNLSNNSILNLVNSTTIVRLGSANQTLSYCGNITGAVSNLCTITSGGVYNDAWINTTIDAKMNNGTIIRSSNVNWITSNQLFNSSDQMLAAANRSGLIINQTGGIIGYNTSWNESRADTKYALIGIGGNSSWNQSLADTLYEFKEGLCYQESANVSTSCGGLNTGIYSFNYDPNGESGIGLDSTYDFYINYSKPYNVLNSFWQVKGDSYSSPTIMNISIPIDCISNNINLRVRWKRNMGNDIYGYYECYNFSSLIWHTLSTMDTHGYNGGSIGDCSLMYDGNWNTGARDLCVIDDLGMPFLFEEAMWWNISEVGYHEEHFKHGNTTQEMINAVNTTGLLKNYSNNGGGNSSWNQSYASTLYPSNAALNGNYTALNNSKAVIGSSTCAAGYALQNITLNFNSPPTAQCILMSAGGSFSNNSDISVRYLNVSQINLSGTNITNWISLNNILNYNNLSNTSIFNLVNGKVNSTAINESGINDFLDDPTHNLGLGTSTPVFKLTVVGDGNFTGNVNASQLCIKGVCQSSWGFANGVTNNSGYVNFSMLTLGSATNTGLSAGWLNMSGNLIVNTSKFYVNAATGRVGIGTIPTISTITITDVLGTTYIDGSGVGIVRNPGYLGTNTGGGDLYIIAGGNNRMFIQNSSGYVGINTASPTDRLTVNGGANVSGNIQSFNVSIRAPGSALVGTMYIDPVTNSLVTVVN